MTAHRCPKCGRNFKALTAAMKGYGACAACKKIWTWPSYVETLKELPFETLETIHGLFEKATTPRASNPWAARRADPPQGVITQTLSKVRKLKLESIRPWDLPLVVLADELFLRLRERWNWDMR